VDDVGMAAVANAIDFGGFVRRGLWVVVSTPL